MNEPHRLGARATSQETVEAVDPKFVVEGLMRARSRTIHALEQVRTGLKEGMTEDEGGRLALDVFRANGVTKHWHKPWVRFGPGTCLTFNDPVQPEYRLQWGDAYYLDVGPVWSDPELGLEYEGDYGDSFVFGGSNPAAEACAAAARRLFADARALWLKEGVSGQEIYRFMQRRADELGVRLLEDVLGHRLGDFPHHKYFRDALGQVPFRPSGSLWVLEVMVVHPTASVGAFFEDLL
ncbi:M24 family metallopeptidase [Sorangium sp. So ce726]|uniref:M24 family metallopeptidase n=1 Tax=Sorangium sp. So ce726 TaxID=3133319 RepID=UPI003F609047